MVKLLDYLNTDKPRHAAFSCLFGVVLGTMAHLIGFHWLWGFLVAFGIGVVKEIMDGSGNTMKEHGLDLVADLVGLSFAALPFIVRVI